MNPNGGTRGGYGPNWGRMAKTTFKRAKSQRFARAEEPLSSIIIASVLPLTRTSPAVYKTTRFLNTNEEKHDALVVDGGTPSPVGATSAIRYNN